MKSYIENETFVVSLSNSEACELINGASFADRRNPLGMNDKVEVRPFGIHDPSYEPSERFLSSEWWHNYRTYKCVAWFFTNSDVVIYVPKEVPQHALVAAENIPIESVRTNFGGDERKGLLSALPQNGITIRFDGHEVARNAHTYDIR